MVKRIAVYGRYEAKIPVRQRYWVKRKDGVKQRYWKTTKRLKKVKMTGRYEFSGSGKELYKAIAFAKGRQYVPKRTVVEVSAEKFPESPEEYGYEGKWFDSEVKS